MKKSGSVKKNTSAKKEDMSYIQDGESEVVSNSGEIDTDLSQVTQTPKKKSGIISTI